jgi:hypothetical protein
VTTSSSTSTLWKPGRSRIGSVLVQSQSCQQHVVVANESGLLLRPLWLPALADVPFHLQDVASALQLFPVALLAESESIVVLLQSSFMLGDQLAQLEAPA